MLPKNSECNLVKILKIKGIWIMQFERELELLKRALGKCRIAIRVMRADDSLASTIDGAFLPIFAKDEEKIVPIRCFFYFFNRAF